MAMLKKQIFIFANIPMGTGCPYTPLITATPGQKKIISPFHLQRFNAPYCQWSLSILPAMLPGVSHKLQLQFSCTNIQWKQHLAPWPSIRFRIRHSVMLLWIPPADRGICTAHATHQHEHAGGNRKTFFVFHQSTEQGAVHDA